VDLDRYIADREPQWERLAELARRARRGRTLTVAEVDELVSLYRRASTHLSHVRTWYGDAALESRLTRLVAEANATLTARTGGGARSLAQFFTVAFPAAVWSSRRFVGIAALLMLVPALAFGTWIANSESALEATGDEAVREAYVTEDFEEYYSSEPAAQFSTEVLVNNIQVSFLAFALGIVACVATGYVLAYNGANIGVAAGLFHAAGEPGKFWGLILPHGLLEVTAVIIAGAAGLRIGWAVIAPGDRRRGTAVAEEARVAVTIVLGLVLAFIVAGVIEGFVTPSSLSTWQRVGIGVAAEAIFVAWILARGPAAVAAGWSGRLGETAEDLAAGPDSSGSDDAQSRPVALIAR
jgi:uncharacterized membrane protein SpoIIM required for sporulation